MSATTATPQTFATLIAEAKTAALRVLTDILATSEDPKERRQAATAILRIPDPKPEPLPHTPPPDTNVKPPSADRVARVNTMRSQLMQEVDRSLQSLATRRTDGEIAELLDLAFPPGGRRPFPRSRQSAPGLAAAAGAGPPT